MRCSTAISNQKNKWQKQWESEVFPWFDKQDYNKQHMTNGHTKLSRAINVLHKALKCQDVSIRWSLRHLLELFCPRAVTWIQVHCRKIEVEQTKVSQFLPCDSESFPHNIQDSGCIHITSVPPQFLSENVSPSASQMRMCKINEKHTENMAKWTTTSLLHLIENIFSAEEVLSQFQNSTTEIHDVCLYCCKAWGSRACYTGKGGRGGRTSNTRLIIDSFLL